METLEMNYIDSREVAEMVGKRHYNLIRDIQGYADELGKLKIESSNFFKESSYTTSQNKTLPCYLVSKKGCEFIANKLTGVKGTEFTARYINKFHDMEDTIKTSAIQYSDMSPELQLVASQLQAMAKVELEQKEQAKKLETIEAKQDTMTATFYKATDKEFRPWVNKCLSNIADSQNFIYAGNRADKNREVRRESYERLNRKRPVRLEQRVINEQKRAIKAGASKTRARKINNLTIIENDNDLKNIYETVIREMMIAYCVED